jgi:hypothetical protein
VVLLNRKIITPKRTFFGKELPGMVLPPALLMGFMALSFYLLNLVPPSLQAEQVKDYESVEAAERALGIEISLPAYFPDYLAWPPARITLHRTPLLMFSLRFSAADGTEEALSIHQIFSTNKDEHSQAVAKPGVLLGEIPVVIEESQGVLIIGKGEGGIPFNQVRWSKADRYLIVSTLYPPEELLKIARSMKP